MGWFVPVATAAAVGLAGGGGRILGARGAKSAWKRRRKIVRGAKTAGVRMVKYTTIPGLYYTAYKGGRKYYKKLNRQLDSGVMLSKRDRAKLRAYRKGR